MVARVRGNQRGAAERAAGESPAHRLVVAVRRRSAARDTVVVVYRAGAATDGPTVRGRLVDSDVVVVPELPSGQADGDLVAVVAVRSRDGIDVDGSERFLVSHAARLLDADGGVTAYALILNGATSLPVPDDVASPADLRRVVPDRETPSSPDERAALDDLHRLRLQDLPIDDLPPFEGSIWRTIARALGFG